MRGAVLSFSRQGAALGRRIIALLGDQGIEADFYTTPKYLEQQGDLPIEGGLSRLMEVLFTKVGLVVFVGSCGIAVRGIAPCLKSKIHDPAVLVVDDQANFVISLVSGHIGGANRYARQLAEALNATPVITTATDVNARFSVDAWAAENKLHIDSLKAAKELSAVILERDVALQSDFEIISALPSGVKLAESGDVGICISSFRKKPFDTTLLLVPKALHIGIGCRRGTPLKAIEEAVKQVIKEHRLHPRGIKSVASIDLKQDEAGLLAFIEKHQYQSTFYSAETLAAVQGEFSPSDFVQSVTGVDNVCERSALRASLGGRLLVKKNVLNGVTVAVAEENLQVNFT